MPDDINQRRHSPMPRIPQRPTYAAAQTKKTKRWLIVPVAAVLAGSVFFAFYYFRQYKKIERNPNAVVEEEVKKITGKIEKFMDLPADEQPTLATVSDKEKLKEQVFFAKAQNGDKVLIYQNAKKAILYRPSENRIIEVMVLNSTE